MLPPPLLSTLFPYTTLFRSVESLFSKLEKTTERAAATREQLYAELKHEITAHSTAEEKAIYPLLKQREPTEEIRSEEHTSELQSQSNLVCRLLLEKKKTTHK